MDCIKFITNSDHSTIDISKQFGSFILDKLNSNKGNDSRENARKSAIALYGGLGVGKTTFVQGFARGLGVSEDYYITSPTYNIINEYPAESLTLYHIDLYRIGSPDELEYIGFDDIAASENSVIIVEWADILDSYNKKIVKFDFDIHIDIEHNFNRVISFIPYGLDSLNLLKRFA